MDINIKVVLKQKAFNF